MIEFMTIVGWLMLAFAQIFVFFKIFGLIEVGIRRSILWWVALIIGGFAVLGSADAMPNENVVGVYIDVAVVIVVCATGIAVFRRVTAGSPRGAYIKKGVPADRQVSEDVPSESGERQAEPRFTTGAPAEINVSWATGREYRLNSAETLIIQYRSLSGDVTERTITPMSITAAGRKHRRVSHLTAYCHLRNAPRTFSVGGIRSAVVADTGEVIDDLQGWLLERMGWM